MGFVWMLAAGSCLALVPAAHSTVVRFNTVRTDNQPGVSTIDVRLYNTATPLTVANFLNYVNNSRYNGTFIHRSVPGFVIQGGGYIYDGSGAPHIATFPAVQNEFGISNLRGTISMAKLGGDPNSATSEWFFNLSDSNAGSCPNGLDCQNGGFTVFGRVVGAGMTVVDAIAALPRYDLDGSGSTFDTVPLRTTTSLQDGLIFLNSVQVLNYKAGDYDFNGTVNQADYTVWRSTLGSTTNAAADGNGNGIVDTADYILWRKTLGQSGGPGAGSGAGLDSFGVPEPSTAALILLVGTMLTFYRVRFSPRRMCQTR
jgi:peptidyl-prolyl cis-trans isomerase A (cyclophilin A)